MIPYRLILSVAFMVSLFGLASCTALRVLTHDTTTDLSRLESGNYEIDPNHVSVIFKIDHFGFSSYVGRFNSVNAALDFDPATPAESVLNVVIDTASVDSRNAFIDAQLKGPAMFDAAKHPEITFVSTKTEPGGGDTARVTGDLTLAGATHPVILEIVLNGAGSNPLTRAETLGFSAKAVFRRSEFGLSAWIPAVGDTVSVEIEAEFVRRDER